MGHRSGLRSGDGGRLPTDLEALLRAMREMIGDVTESEVRATIIWARESKFISV